MARKKYYPSARQIQRQATRELAYGITDAIFESKEEKQIPRPPSFFGYRSKYIAAAVALFYGIFGLHYFYLGDSKKGFFMFLFVGCTLGLIFLVAVFSLFYTIPGIPPEGSFAVDMIQPFGIIFIPINIYYVCKYMFMDNKKFDYMYNYHFLVEIGNIDINNESQENNETNNPPIVEKKNDSNIGQLYYVGNIIADTVTTIEAENKNMKTEYNIPSAFDPLFKQAVELVIANPQQASELMLVNKLKIEFKRAERIMGELEVAGVVAPQRVRHITRPRAVLIKSMDDLEGVLKKNILHNKEKNKEIKKIEPMNTRINVPIPRNYFVMLKDIKNEILAVRKKLENDNNLIGLELATKINGSIYSDLRKIYRLLYSSHYNVKNKLEAFGLAIIAASLTKNEIDISDSQYSYICLSFEKGFFDDMIKTSVTKGDWESDELLTPSLLKLSNSPLYDEYVTILYRYAVTLVKADGIEDVNESAKLKNIYNILYNTQPNHNADTIIKEHIGNDIIKEQNIAKSGTSNSIVSNETLDDILNELNNDIIGLTSVKEEVNSLVNLINVQNQRQKAGLPVQPLSYHLVFTGNPGTGKTTIARMISKIYKHLGILKNGTLIETDRAGLIAEYVGQTASKVNKVVDSALNNVLFIDEAYSLVSEGSNDYGKEAVATLIKRMEDDRDKLVLIIAGYTNEMKKFIDTNPGVKSRFNKFIEFDDYTPYELYQIFELQCKKLKFNLRIEAIEKVKSIFSAAYQQRDKSFGNGRFARNFFEKVQQNQANRIASTPTVDLEVLTTIKLEDIPNA